MKSLSNFFHHLFIPHEGNNFRAKSLHPDFLMMYLVFALVLTFVFKTTGSNVLGFATDITVEKLYQLTNQEREKNNLSPLVLNDCLSQAARKKATDMFSKNYWAHISPTGTTPWDFMIDTGCKYEYAGENLAKNFLFSDGVVTAWMNSPSHKENIVNSNYTQVGYAIVNGVLNGEETTLIVQMFNKPVNQVAKANTEPMIKPKAVEAKEIINVNEKPITAQKINNTKANLSNLPININVIFILFLLAALALDFYFAAKFNIIRFGGKNLAHFIFITFIFIGLVYVFINGSII